MSVKTKVLDLLEECDGEFDDFYIDKGFLYDAADKELEGSVKITICKKSNDPVLKIHVLKVHKWFCSEPVDVDRLDDPSEKLKIRMLLDDVRVALLT